jgi:hypothetical protein
MLRLIGRYAPTDPTERGILEGLGNTSNQIACFFNRKGLFSCIYLVFVADTLVFSDA